MSKRPAKKWRPVAFLVPIPVVLGLGLRWLVSAPIDAAGYPATPTVSSDVSAALEPAPPPEWPEDRLEGPEAKRLLRDALVDLVERLECLEGYTAVLRRQERVGGRLLPEQTLRIKVRHRPSSIYLRNVGVRDGCEIIYVDGLRDGKLISHPGGLVGLVVPPMELDPRSPLAMSQSRFPITEAGLLPAARLLRDDLLRDLDDPGASVVLDRQVDAEGRPRYRSRLCYDAPSPARPFSRVEVLYDPDTLLIREITFSDWPDAPGADDAPLGCRFVVVDFDPSAVPSDLDFDATNPAYDFQ